MQQWIWQKCPVPCSQGDVGMLHTLPKGPHSLQRTFRGHSQPANGQFVQNIKETSPEELRVFSVGPFLGPSLETFKTMDDRGEAYSMDSRIGTELVVVGGERRKTRNLS